MGLLKGKYKIGLRRIKQFLADQDAYSLQKRVQRNFKRNRVIVKGLDSQWDMDLMDVRNLSKYNNGIQYILVAQDVFSRYVLVVPMKNKSANENVKALELLLSRGRKPEIIRTDQGGEFQNKRVTSYLKDLDIHQIFAQKETKSNYSERAIQNLKNRMYRMFTERQSYKFIDNLQDIVKSVNDTPSRPLGNVAPSSINKINEDEIRLNSYLIRTKTKREYQQKWTGEVFKVYKRFVRDGLPVYKLRDFNDDIIRGTFMTQEMQKVNKDENTIWKIDKILKQRKVNDCPTIYPSNQGFDFRVHLPKPQQLVGNWDISLLDFTYQGSKPISEPDIFICCNLAEEDTIVGENEIPLLRRVFARDAEVNIIYNNPYSVPVKIGVFQDVHVYITTSKNELASFLTGPVTVTLQLKRTLF
ncbi:hypothetical protein KUTeg_009263 [Tegillarca granosa]|uniref:Integrase catalytic domain-containing protein n=1 Tax=Tegillarca granosa TaxID=220873 RepID=A0ABQ9FBY5_TEGGR|nr:hypothetical protein KUTeg_009263 [Tegillarca granosa]